MGLHRDGISCLGVPKQRLRITFGVDYQDLSRPSLTSISLLLPTINVTLRTISLVARLACIFACLNHILDIGVYILHCCGVEKALLCCAWDQTPKHTLGVATKGIRISHDPSKLIHHSLCSVLRMNAHLAGLRLDPNVGLQTWEVVPLFLFL